MLATVEELADFIGEPIGGDSGQERQAQMLLAYASSLVESYVGRVFDAGSVPSLAVNVTLAVAARGYTNFEGFTSEAVDDWRGSGRIVQEAGLFLTSTEKKALDTLRSGRSPLGRVSTWRGDMKGQAGGWIPTSASGQSMPIPW